LNAPEEDYEHSLAAGSLKYVWKPPVDEFDSIALNYTSGTTGEPKGVLLHHRGACVLLFELHTPFSSGLAHGERTCTC
jgi:long-subunit acyl-CoA synthetase (AMP-forming)